MSVELAAQAEQSLAELAERFEQWRRTRARAHESIPVPLWDQAVTLSRVLSDSQVAKRLRLSQTDLKKRRLAQASPALNKMPAPAPPFVELTPPAPGPAASSEPLLVEFERPDGARMRLRYPQSPPLAALVQAFLERS
jgi:hypothetical protein